MDTYNDMSDPANETLSNPIRNSMSTIWLFAHHGACQYRYQILFKYGYTMKFPFASTFFYHTFSDSSRSLLSLSTSSAIQIGLGGVRPSLPAILGSEGFRPLLAPSEFERSL